MESRRFQSRKPFDAMMWSPIVLWRDTLKNEKIFHSFIFTALLWLHFSVKAYPTTRLFFSTACSVWQRKHQSSALPILCEGNPPVTGGFPSQRVSNVWSASMSRRFYEKSGSRLEHPHRDDRALHQWTPVRATPASCILPEGMGPDSLQEKQVVAEISPCSQHSNMLWYQQTLYWPNSQGTFRLHHRKC